MSALVAEFRRQIVRPTLRHLDPLVPYSRAAENLLVGTAVHESGLRALVQAGGGPALGFYQIEPATHLDVWMNYLQHHPAIAEAVNELAAKEPPLAEQLVSNLRYATAIARLVYWRSREPMPAAEDAEGLARMWKRVFNTRLGKGTEAAFLAAYSQIA